MQQSSRLIKTAVSNVKYSAKPDEGSQQKIQIRSSTSDAPAPIWMP